RILDVEDLDLGFGDHVREALDALVVDDGRNAAQDDDLALVAELVGEPAGSIRADRNVVACNVEILNRRIGQAAINDGDEGALGLYLLDGAGELLGGEWQDHKRVELAGRRQVLKRRDLSSRG